VIRLLDKYLQLSVQGKILRGKLLVEKGVQVQRTILSQLEIKQLYEQTEDSPMELRDRAVLGIYYGCGLRSTEGIRVELKHIQYEKNSLYVLPGKNGKSRQVPISEKVKRDLKDYEVYGRKHLIKEESNHLLISYFGGKIKRGCSFNPRLKQLTKKAGIQKEISLHSLRHSIATHLLQQGMPLEQISRFLGHTSLDSTQIYTRIIEELDNGEL
jgi:site-specific recombinase XerD